MGESLPTYLSRFKIQAARRLPLPNRASNNTSSSVAGDSDLNLKFMHGLRVGVVRVVVLLVLVVLVLALGPNLGRFLLRLS
jgi:hypothetical protein